MRQKNDKGQTALHCAAGFPGGLQTCKWLVSKGADVNAPDVTGETPLHIASMVTCSVGTSKMETARFLLENGAKWDTLGGPLQISPWVFLAPCLACDVKTFLDHKADPNAVLPKSVPRDEFRNTVLAKLPGDNVISQVAPHLEGCTPLMIAAWIGHIESVEALIEAKADPMQKTASGWTALDFCKDGSCSGKVVDILAKKR